MKNVNVYITIYILISTASYLILGNFVILPVFISLAFLLTMKPEYNILLILIIISSIIYYDNLPMINIGIGSLHIADILLLYVMFHGCVGYINKNKFIYHDNNVSKFLIIFYTFAFSSFIYGTYINNISFNDGMRVLRMLSYYLLYVIFALIVNKIEKINFMLKSINLVVVVVVATMILQALFGTDIVLMAGRVEDVTVFDETMRATRILPPGQDLLYFVFIISLTVSICCKNDLSNHYYKYLMIITFVGLLLTFNRNYWISTLIVMIILYISNLNNYRKLSLPIYLFLIKSMTLVVIIFTILTPNKMTDYIESIETRVSSLLSVNDIYNSDTIKYRLEENEYAFKAISNNLFWGVGVGGKYRPGVDGMDDSMTKYIHNGYLYMLLNTGIFGLTFFIIFYYFLLRRLYVESKKIVDIRLKSIVIGIYGACIGLLFINIVNPVFMKWYSIVSFTVIIGLSESIINYNKYINKVTTRKAYI